MRARALAYTLSRKMPKAAKKSRSGSVFTEEDYAELGYRTIKLRLPAEDGALLDELCSALDMKPTKVVCAALRTLAKSTNRKR